VPLEQTQQNSLLTGPAQLLPFPLANFPPTSLLSINFEHRATPAHQLLIRLSPVRRSVNQSAVATLYSSACRHDERHAPTAPPGKQGDKLISGDLRMNRSMVAF